MTSVQVEVSPPEDTEEHKDMGAVCCESREGGGAAAFAARSIYTTATPTSTIKTTATTTTTTTANSIANTLPPPLHNTVTRHSGAPVPSRSPATQQRRRQRAAAARGIRQCDRLPGQHHHRALHAAHLLPARPKQSHGYMRSTRW